MVTGHEESNHQLVPRVTFEVRGQGQGRVTEGAEEKS